MFIFLNVLWFIISIILIFLIDSFPYLILSILFVGILMQIFYVFYNRYIRRLLLIYKVPKKTECFRILRHIKELGCIDHSCLYKIRAKAKNIYVDKRMGKGYYRIFVGIGCKNYYHFIGYIDEEKYGRLKPMTRIEIIDIRDGCCAIIKPKEILGIKYMSSMEGFETLTNSTTTAVLNSPNSNLDKINCPYCNSSDLEKIGIIDSKKFYFCKNCNKEFSKDENNNFGNLGFV